MRAARRRALAFPMLVVAAVAVGAGFTAAATGVVAQVEGEAADVRYELRGESDSTELAIVAIDEDTFSELDHTWPLPRTDHARAVDRLREAGARQIVYDVQFTEPSPRPAADMALYRAIARAGHVVLATGESTADGRTNVLGGDEVLAEAGARAAASNFPADHGGVIRRYSRAVGKLETVATATAEMLGHDVPPSAFDDGTAWIDFRGGPGSFPTYSFSDVIEGRVDPEAFRGRVVVVGATAPTLQDVHPSATSGSRLMAGPELQAHAIWTAVHANPLRSAPAWAPPLAILLLGLAGPLVVLALGPVRLLLAGPVIAALAAGAAFVLFDHGIVVAVAAPGLALLLGIVGGAGAGLVAEARERRRADQWAHELEAEVRRRTQELRDTQLEVVTRLARAAELRDTDTGEHIDRMSHLCERVGLALGMSPEEAELLRHASVLHDIGKIGTPDGVLLKPGRLDDDEREVMQRHTLHGADVLAGSDSPLLQLAEQVARTHHERWDGDGYPLGLAGEQIPLVGRIAAACDVYDALTSERPYKRAWSHEEACEHIAAESGSHFDPRVVDALLAMLTAPAPRTEPRSLALAR